ncbi:MAG: hypothetical protein JKY42_05995 [Flavobacteriales bacterium]|nr:hypothetical protein [Flavobacteriales bacterium]
MKIFKSKISLIAIALLVTSCVTNPYKSVTIVKQPIEGVIVLTPAFKDLLKGKLYKAKIEVLKNYLSGLLIIKEIKGSNRVIFTSETGLKFFDFEFAADTFIVHHVMEQFDNKYVLNTLREDLGTVLFDKVGVDGIQKITIDKIDGKIYRRQEGEDWLYYFYQKDILNKIERASDKKKKVIITFENYEDDIPQLINIAHKDFKMNIELNYIKR